MNMPGSAPGHLTKKILNIYDVSVALRKDRRYGKTYRTGRTGHAGYLENGGGEHKDVP
jgi:hypothetical protein